MRTRMVLAAALTAACLSACSEDPGEAYCQAVKDNQTELGKISKEGGSGGLLSAVKTLDELGEQAPSDIRDEWQTLLKAVDGLADVVEETGIDPATYDAKEPPADVSAADRKRIAEAATDLASNEVRLASAGIEQHSLDVCKTPIGL